MIEGHHFTPQMSWNFSYQRNCNIIDIEKQEHTMFHCFINQELSKTETYQFLTYKIGRLIDKKHQLEKEIKSLIESFDCYLEIKQREQLLKYRGNLDKMKRGIID